MKTKKAQVWLRRNNTPVSKKLVSAVQSRADLPEGVTPVSLAGIELERRKAILRVLNYNPASRRSPRWGADSFDAELREQYRALFGGGGQ